MNSINYEREPLIIPHALVEHGTLPLDVFNLIHSSLNPMHTELFATVSKTWNLKCIELKKNEFLLIKPFIDWLNQNLNEEYTDQKNKLLACYNVNESFKSIMNQIQTVLQELDHETVMELKALSIKDEKPKFFKDSLHLAEVDKGLKSIFQQIASNQNAKDPNINYINIFFQSASEELAQKGYFYKSIEVVDMITKDREKDYALEFIAKELFRDRLFNQTQNLLLKMSERNHLVQYFINILVKHNETQMARNYMSMLFY